MNYKYYSMYQPIIPGGYPRMENIKEIRNFDRKIFCEEIGGEAWGYISYYQLLPEGIAENYGLKLAGIRTWYCVTSSYDDKGNAIAAITAIQEALKQPESTYTSIKRKDIYCDWYGNQEEAQAAVEAVKKA